MGENRRKLDNLDNALLFAIGSVTLIITFLQINLNDLTQVIEAIPFVILGIILPFVVGYLRGSIEFDTIEERVRGWIYFFIGIFSYFGFFFVFRLKQLPYIITETLFIIILVIGMVVTFLFIKWSNRIFGVENKATKYAYSGTILGAMVSAFLLRFIAGMYLDIQGHDLFTFVSGNYLNLILFITIGLFSFSIVMIFEKGSAYSLKVKIENSKSQKKHHPFVTGVKAGLSLFSYLLNYEDDNRHSLLLFESFIFWLTATIFLAFKAQLMAIVFYGCMLIFWVFSCYFLYRLQINNFKNLEDSNKGLMSAVIWCVLMLFLCGFLLAFGGNPISTLEIMGFIAVYLIYSAYFIRKKPLAKS
jgi:hypothetical protein